MKRTKSTLNMAMWLLVSTLICGSSAVFTSCGNMDNALEEIINANPTAKGISFAQSKVAVHFGDDTFTNALTNKGDGTVTYTSSNTAVATVNPTTGEVTPVDLGTTTITATVTESGDYTYETKTASYELSVGVSILKWDETLKEMKTEEVTSGVTLTGTIDNTTITAGTYIIYDNATITGDVTLTDDVELILSDGSKLNITGQIDGHTNSKALTIYAQSEGTNMGQLNVEKANGNAITINGLTIHGGKITAKATTTSQYQHCINMFGNLNIYGGEVKAQGADNTSNAGYGINLYVSGTNYTVNIQNHAKVEVIGGKSTGGHGGIGIRGHVTINDYAELTVTGGDGGSGYGGDGIYQTLTASGHAKVKVNGGNGTGSGDVKGGSGIGGVYATVKDYAQVEVTGGNGIGNEVGGKAIHDNLNISGNAYVEATGGNGGTSGNGGDAVGSDLTISGNTYVEATGGNGGTSGNGGHAVGNDLNYNGGTFVALGGAKGTSGTNGRAIDGGLANNTASSFFEYYDGTNWNNFDVSSGYNFYDQVHSRGVRKLD